MQTLIIVLHLMIVLALIGVVLMQKSEGGALGMGGGGGLTSRGSANVLTRATAYLAAAFFGTSLLLSILAGASHKGTSILPGGGDTAPAQQEAPGGLPPLSLPDLGGGSQPAAPPPGGAPQK